MTEESNVNEEDYLVCVTAQVMTREDSKGGWFPVDGGGLSTVYLRKLNLPNPGDQKHEYHIHGHRFKDKQEVLNCILRRDVQYTKANPTFYHWTTVEGRFGLTFQKSADAKAFDRAVKHAIEELLEGTGESKLEAGEDDVFMTLDLPFERKDSSSQSTSTTSTTTSSPAPQSPHRVLNDPFNFNHPSNHQHLHRVHYMSRPPRRSQSSPSNTSDNKITSDRSIEVREPDVWIPVKTHKALRATKSDQGHLEEESVELIPDSYVHFQKKRTSVHDYQYPTMDPMKGNMKRDSTSSSLKKYTADIVTNQPPLPQKNWDGLIGSTKQNKLLLSHSERARCVYCNETFIKDENPRGGCPDAPDRGYEIVECLSCMRCARCPLYHCVADADGYNGHPCSCDSQDELNCKKWTALTILSFFCPCLWCYWPLKLCHTCGTHCGCCGGRHTAT